MNYWSKGLGRRALIIDWSKGATEISVEEAQQLLATVIPLHQIRGELPPRGAQIIVAGNTRPPIVWRYISVLARADFESIVKLVTSPAMVRFLVGNRKGWGLFAKLAGFLVVFSLKYSWAWLGGKILVGRARGPESEAVSRAGGNGS